MEIHLGRRWFTQLVCLLFVLFLIAALPRTSADGTYVAVPVPPPMALSDQRDTIVAQESRRAGVPVRLALAVSHVENTSGDSMAVSKRGAVGIMQVLPKYWQHEFEDDCGCGSLFARRRNACVGVRVLGRALQKYKTTNQALRAYHGSLKLHAAGDKYISDVLDQSLVR